MPVLLCTLRLYWREKVFVANNRSKACQSETIQMPNIKRNLSVQRDVCADRCLSWRNWLDRSLVTSAVAPATSLCMIYDAIEEKNCFNCRCKCFGMIGGK